MDELLSNKYREEVKFNEKELYESHALLKIEKQMGMKYEDLDYYDSEAIILFKRALVDDDFDAVEFILITLIEEE